VIERDCDNSDCPQPIYGRDVLDTALGSHLNYRRLAGFFFATAFFATAFFFGAARAGLVRWLMTFFGPVSITELSAFKFSYEDQLTG
jgi:hypothetical protein